jgi:hypothetical protein
MSRHSAKLRNKPQTAPAQARTTAQTPEARNSVLGLQRTAGNRAVTDLLTGSPGKPLDRATQDKMESSFQEEFDDVRIHSGRTTRGAVEILGADAFTSGRDIVFGEGKYSPESKRGEKLLAHELAHVVQQRRGGSAPRAFEPNSSVEQDAGAAAAQFSSGSGPVSVNAASGPGVARQESDEPWWKKRLNPLYQRALEVLPKDAAAKLEQANEGAKALVKSAGVSDEGLNQAVRAAEPALAPIGLALGVKDSSAAPPPASGPSPTPATAPAPPTSAATPKTDAPPSAAAPGDSLGAMIPFFTPGGGTTPTPSVPEGPFTPPEIPVGQPFANIGWDIAARQGVFDQVAPQIAPRAIGLLPRAGVAGAAFAAGFLGPFAIGYAREHGAELQEQPDPDVRDQAIAGAPPPITDDLDAGAPEVQQAPSAGTPPPALDPGTQNSAVLPPQQDPAPVVDPAAKDSAQLPGPSSDAAELGGSSRPGLRDSTILQVWQNALRRGKGVVRDPASGEKLEPPYYDANGKLVYDWHMGHLEDHEWWRLRKLHEAGKLTWAEVIEQYNDPSHYHPEDPSENVSHEHESKTEYVLPDGTVIRPGPGRPFRRLPTRNKQVRRKR